MARVTVRFVEAGVRELLNSPEVTKICEDPMRRVLAAARDTAPVVSGTYRDSLQLRTTHGNRVRVHVLSTVPYAMQVEAIHGTLLKALDAAGGA